jgi:hypothetical protein
MTLARMHNTGLIIEQRASRAVEKGGCYVIDTRHKPQFRNEYHVDFMIFTHDGGLSMEACAMAVNNFLLKEIEHRIKRQQRLLPVPMEYAPRCNYRRPAPTNCQHEPPYPGTPTVVMSIRDPHMTVHDASVNDYVGSLGYCNRHAPHRTSICGRWGESNERRDYLTPKVFFDHPLNVHHMILVTDPAV